MDDDCRSHGVERIQRENAAVAAVAFDRGERIDLFRSVHRRCRAVELAAIIGESAAAGNCVAERVAGSNVEPEQYDDTGCNADADFHVVVITAARRVSDRIADSRADRVADVDRLADAFPNRIAVSDADARFGKRLDAENAFDSRSSERNVRNDDQFCSGNFFARRSEFVRRAN